jgi:hypothetical protein
MAEINLEAPRLPVSLLSKWLPFKHPRIDLLESMLLLATMPWLVPLEQQERS